MGSRRPANFQQEIVEQALAQERVRRAADGGRTNPPRRPLHYFYRHDLQAWTILPAMTSWRRRPRSAVRRARRASEGFVTTGLRRYRPLVTRPGELESALGGRTLAAQLRIAATALPSVGAWYDALAPEPLLACAERVMAHEFDLLGSGPVQLGPVIDYGRDFANGRRWPLRDPRCLVLESYDGSDVKLPWELSRFQHLPILAAARHLTGEQRFTDEIGRELTRWIRGNPVGIGVNWACTMDVAIRGVNWLATLTALKSDDVCEPWMPAVADNLLLHAQFIRGHIEDGEVRGNHYLADLTGLLVIASLFTGSKIGRRWADYAAAAVLAELDSQVRADGVVHEASISYHRLVCELFICGLDAINALFPGRVTTRHRARIDAMLQFVADYTRPDGLAPQIGDADSGRFLPLGDYAGVDQRRHDHLFTQARRPSPPARFAAAYPNGGFFVARTQSAYLCVRCGDTGMAGTGVHAHNDQLSFELAVGTQPLVVDPGTYVYTPSPAWRNRFRSTAAHSTLSIDGAEQNPLPARLFLLPDQTNARMLGWSGNGTTVHFTGEHVGYERLVGHPRHTRTLTLEGQRLVITDTIDSRAAHALQWTFPLATSDAVAGAGGVVAEFPGLRLTIRANHVAFTIEPGWLSPAYGVREPAAFARARRQIGAGRSETTFTLTVQAT